MTFSTTSGRPSRILPAPKRVMKVSRPGGVVGVEPRGERDGVVGGGRRAELDADRVAHVAEQLDVGAVELAGALADPDEVRRQVVGRAAAGVDAGHRVLVLEDQRLVAGVEVDAVELVGVGADGLHERHRPVDLVGQRVVALPGHGVGDEVGVPGVDLAQVGVAAGDERADHAQRGRGGAVHLEQAARVGHPRVGGEVVAVDGVAAVGRQRDALAVDEAGLEVGGARLGVLAGQAAELDHRHGGGVGQHDGHLQQHAQLVAGVVGGDAGEGLGAVAALQQERLAARDGGELVGQLVALVAEDERTRGCAAARRSRRRGPVGVGRLLGRVERVERGEIGDGHTASLRGPADRP